MRRHTTGRPAALTPEVAERLLSMVADGVHITTACSAAGIARSTFYLWLDRARLAQERLDDGETLDPHDWACVELSERLGRARALGEMKAVSVVMAASRGGTVIRERPIVDAQGRAIVDGRGPISWERWRSAPDGRLMLDFLARRYPERWRDSPARRDPTFDT